MPNPLSQTQTRQVNEAIDAQVRRHLRPWKIYIVSLVIGIAIGAAVGVYAYTTTVGYARSVSCQRGRAVSLALALVVHTAIPPHQKGRTPDEEKAVRAFYRKVAPALKVPSCN